MDRPGYPAQWNISGWWPLPVKSPAQSLDYRANSYHIYLSTLRFHGYGEQISQICPCPFCPINSSFSGTPSPPHHSTAPTPLSRRRRCLRAPRSPTKPFLHQPQSLRSSFFARRWPSTSLFPRSVHHLTSCNLPHPCSSVIYFTERFPFSSFVLLFTFKTIRICPIKLSSLPISHTFNVLVH